MNKQDDTPDEQQSTQFRERKVQSISDVYQVCIHTYGTTEWELEDVSSFSLLETVSVRPPRFKSSYRVGPPYRYRCSCCYCLPAVPPLKCGSWRVRGILDEPPKCCTQIAESHQTPQEPWIDAKTVRNFITGSTRDSLHTTAKEPPVKVANRFYTVQQGKREGKLKGIG